MHSMVCPQVGEVNSLSHLLFLPNSKAVIWISVPTFFTRGLYNILVLVKHYTKTNILIIYHLKAEDTTCLEIRDVDSSLVPVF